MYTEPLNSDAISVYNWFCHMAIMVVKGFKEHSEKGSSYLHKL